VEVAAPAPGPEQIARLGAMLAGARRPMTIVGGSRWDAEAVRAAQAFCARHDMPLAASFRRQGLCDAEAPVYAGDVGLGINPALRDRIAASDLLILLGCRFSENPSQDFSLLGIPDPGKPLVHVHPGAEELGRIYAPELAINATPGAFLRAAAALPPRLGTGAVAAAHADYRAWSATRPRQGGRGVDMGAVIAALNAALPPDAVVTNGAGNYAIWLHRFFRYRGWGTQLAPVSGSMGYGLPAAIAAKLRRPDRPVICLAGDGCFQMTLQELGTAAQLGAGVVALVCDNAMYGTIRMHQARRFPGRLGATDLANPDFAALARSYGCHAETVRRDADVAPALERALAAARDRPAVIHLLTDADAITPAARLSTMEQG
jgi:acetolactate synthase-1/2/3 large subunit